MANKLEDLSIEKVAFVPEGDNKGANVLLFKSKDSSQPVVTSKTETATPEGTENVLKRIFLAIGKALGFDGQIEGEPPTQEKFTPEGTPDNKPTEPQATPAEPAEPPEPTTTQTGEEPTQKGVISDMKIDKSKLTPEELAALEAIEKKAGIQEDPAPEGNGAPAATEPTATPTQKAAEPPAAAPVSEGEEDIYKGLHPAIKAELERLRKQADTMEERELQEVAKKYEIIGKKADELVPTLKSLKAAGGDTYDQMIAVLDASVAAVEKSGLFTEVGKRGASGESDAWAAIEKHAETIQKSAPTMTWNQAIDKACEQHPDLVHDYESGR